MTLSIDDELISRTAGQFNARRLLPPPVLPESSEIVRSRVKETRLDHSIYDPEGRSIWLSQIDFRVRLGQFVEHIADDSDTAPLLIGAGGCVGIDRYLIRQRREWQLIRPSLPSSTSYSCELIERGGKIRCKVDWNAPTSSLDGRSDRQSIGISACDQVIDERCPFILPEIEPFRIEADQARRFIEGNTGGSIAGNLLELFEARCFVVTGTVQVLTSWVDES